MLKINYRNSRHSYMLIILLIFISGSPILNNAFLYGILGLGFLLYSVLFLNMSRRRKLWVYMLFFVIIFILQYINLHYISILGSINLLMKLMIGATVMWITKDKFRYIYTDVLFYLSVISLFFYIIGLLGLSIPNLFSNDPNRSSILVYNTLSQSSYRNCGPFWEPGAFACYLILVPLLFIDNLREFVISNKSKTLVLSVTLISTISTTGYICLFIIIVYYLITFSKNRFISYLIYVPIVLVMISYAFVKLDFMSEKIEEQTLSAVDLDGEFSNTRLGSLMFDLHYIKKHPIIGNGLHERTRYADHPSLWGQNLGHGNAFSNYTAQMGTIAMIVYFLLLYQAFSKRIIVPIIVLLLFQGEQLLNYPLFLSLPFVILYIKKNTIRNIRGKTDSFWSMDNNMNL